jgi:hypothetical protein
MAKGKFVSYLRVSTDKQGRSGLGVEAQLEAVARYLTAEAGSLSPNTLRQRAGNGVIVQSSLLPWGTQRPLGPLWCSLSSID